MSHQMKLKDTIIKTLLPTDKVVKYSDGDNLYLLVDSLPLTFNLVQKTGAGQLETKDYGLVALLPVGMSQVSSVNFEPWLKVGDTVKKGDPFGFFLFGGSDIVMVFQKGVLFNMTAPRSGSGYKHIMMGEEYGRLGKAR